MAAKVIETTISRLVIQSLPSTPKECEQALASILESRGFDMGKSIQFVEGGLYFHVRQEIEMPRLPDVRRMTAHRRAAEYA